MFRTVYLFLILGILSVISITISPLQASTTSAVETTDFTVEELVQLALERSPRPAIAEARLAAARHRADASRGFENPVLQLVPGFTGNAEARDEEVILSQPLDLFGQRKAKHQLLKAQSKRAQAESTLVARALSVEVKSAAVALFAAQESQTLGEAQVVVAKKFSQAAIRRAELGDIPQVQAQRTELELLRTMQDLTRLEAERLEALAALNELLGQEPETLLRVSLGTRSEENEEFSSSDSVFPRRAELLSFLSENPEILSAQAALEAQYAEVNAIEKQRLPQVELQARRSAFFGRDGSYALRAVITTPLFDFGSNKSEKRAAQAEANAQEMELVLLRSKAATRIERSLIRLGKQRVIAAQFRTKIVPETLDLLRKTQIGFSQGASSYLEVLEAQRTIRAVQAEYLQALSDLYQSEIELESALGTAVPDSLLNRPFTANTPAQEGGQ